MNFIAEFEASFGLSSQIFDSTLPEIVFSGKSNVGKSSLINKLINRKSLARVSSKPGKTSTINFYKLKNARFVDLPGYGYAKVSFKEKKRWAELVEGYFNQDRNIALVIQIVDMRHDANSNDMNMIDYLCDAGLPFIVVMTKSDKLNKTLRISREKEIEKQFKCYEGLKILPFSSLNLEGLDELKNIINLAINDSK